MEKLHIQTFSSEHAPIETSRLRIAGRPFLFATWERAGEPPVYGEAAPLPGYGADDLRRAEAALSRLTSDELKEQTRAVAQAFRVDAQGFLLGEQSPLSVVAEWSSALDSPSARYCAEMLVLGAAAGSCGVPLWRLLAHDRVAPALRTSAVVDPLSSTWLVDFEAHHARGVRTFKFKCGRDAAKERAALERAASVADVRLRLDPNRGWTQDEAERFLLEFPPEIFEWVEDPTGDIATWTALRERTAVPLALDEPLALGLAVEAVTTLAPDVLVLKPMALGGYFACVNWAAWAQEHGTSVCVSHLFDGKVAMSATIQLAFVAQSPRFAAGLGEHAALFCDPSGAPAPPGLSVDGLRCPETNSPGS